MGGMRPVPVPAYASAVFQALVQAGQCVCMVFGLRIVWPNEGVINNTKSTQHLPKTGVFAAAAPPNHVLLNEYTAGQGIAPHKDGPLYEDTVAIVSLGAPARLDFWEASDPTAAAAQPARASVQLAPRSLLVFRGPAYQDFFHGILRREDADAGERRVSLTVRRVLRVAEGGEVLETSERRREEKRKEARFLMSITDDRPDL